jgi:hypothetical protein
MSASKLEALPVISPKQDAKPLGLPKPKMGKPPMQKAATDHFNYKYVKILLKSQAKEGNEKNEKIVLLRRSWLQNNNVIPHFAAVIKTVGPNEGVEITMNCNAEAFDWIITITKIKSHFSDDHHFSPLSDKEIKA